MSFPAIWRWRVTFNDFEGELHRLDYLCSSDAELVTEALLLVGLSHSLERVFDPDPAFRLLPAGTPAAGASFRA